MTMQVNLAWVHDDKAHDSDEGMAFIAMASVMRSFDETENIVRYAHDTGCAGRTPIMIGSMILA